MEDIEDITKHKLLIVEGTDEQNFFKAFLRHLSLDDIQVMNMRGKSKIRAKLRALTLAPNFSDVTSLGIIRDADDEPSGAFQSVCDALKGAGLVAPRRQLSFTRGNPKTGIMVLPQPGSKGMLEDVCLNSINDTQEMDCIIKYLDCIKKHTGTLPSNISKSKLYSFLATKEPGLRLGEAALRSVWRWDNPAFEQIKRFLKLL